MELIVFTHALVSIAEDGEVLIALFGGEQRLCVALLKSRRDAAAALSKSLGSALKSATP